MSMQRRLKLVAFGWMPLLLVACSGNTLVGEETPNVPTLAVALNHRLFESPSMTSSPSGGCTSYLLKPGGPGISSGGGNADGLGVSETAVDYTVVVKVIDKDKQVLVEKIYDETFFESGQRDDFTATWSDKTMLVRYWATFDADDRPVCAPFTDDGSQTPLR
jgi:hypothetical protein